MTITIGNSFDGRSHACVLHAGGTVSCWGPGYDGQLGLGDAADHYLPVEVAGITDAVAVAAGWSHTCAAHADGGVSCWDKGDEGQMGDGSGEGRFLPQRVPGLRDVTTVAAGRTYTCAVHRDGTLSCWGQDLVNPVDYESPRGIGNLRGVVSVALGWRQHCAVLTGGQVYCWSSGSPPRRVTNISDAADVAVGDGSFCVLHRDGGVSCWGDNTFGQLGDGTTTARSGPVPLPGVADAVAVTLSVPPHDGGSGAHACAVHGNGSVSCWGDNTFGQLGDGTQQARSSPTRARRPERLPPDRIPENQTLLMRAWADAAIERREAEFPWLRVAWDRIRERAVQTNFGGGVGGAVVPSCEVLNGAYRCRADRMEISWMSFGVLVHELAHVYDITTGLAPSRAWGAVQLYFATTYPDCFTDPLGGGAGVEILADTVAYVIHPSGPLGYHGSPLCPELPGKPTREAQEIVRAGLAGRVPDWYTRNITNGAELWAAIRRGPSEHLLANLATEFGGLCTTDWFTSPLDLDRLPAAGTNPFRDGGC